MCDFLDVQCNMTFFYALFLQCPARVLVCLLCLRTPCREAFSWLCGVISIPNHRSYYSMSYIYSRFTMVTVTEWVTRNMLSREVYTFFLIICCRTSSPVEVFWADHLCFNLSAEKKNPQHNPTFSRCLLPGNKHLINDLYGLQSYSCCEMFGACKEFKALTGFLLFYCLWASSFILNNCYYLCLEVISIVLLHIKLRTMKMIECSDRYRCAGIRGQQCVEYWKVQILFGWLETTKSRAVWPETQPAGPEQRGIPHDQEAFWVCGGAGQLRGARLWL